MNSYGIDENEILQNNSIISLFRINIEERQDVNIEMNLQIIHIKKCENTQKEMYTATLRDKNTKYNGFLFIKDINSPDLIEGSVIKILTISPRTFPNQPSRVFIIKSFTVLYNFIENNNNNIRLIREENGRIMFDNGEIVNLDEPNEDNNHEEEREEDKEYDGRYTNLKQLTTFSRNFTIYVRVTKKSEVKTYSQKSTGKLFYFIVLDREGSEMQVTCFNKAADKFFEMVEENEVYEIKGGYVKINDKKFTTVKSDYKIVLDENATIIHKKDIGIIKAHLTFIKISDIRTQNLYNIVDLCVVVLQVGEKVTKHTRNGDQFMKKIQVGDVSKCKIELSLWRVHANTDVRVGDILLLKHVKIGEFNGRNISTFDETSIVVNPSNVKEANELKEFLSTFTGEYQDLERSKDISGSTNLSDDKYNVSYIKDVLDSLDETEDISTLSTIKATVTQIMHNEKNYYMGCADKNCKRKLVLNEDHQNYTCTTCNKIYDRPTYYYTLSIRVKDCSHEFWIDIFGKNAESLIKMTAEEYKDILMSRNVEKLKEISESIEFKEFYFSVKPKMQMYSNISKKKLYAFRIEEVNMKNDHKKLLKYIKKVLG